MQPHGPGSCPLGWDVAHPSMLPRRGATWTLFRSAIYIYLYMVCLVPHFTQKILGFGPSFCKMKLNTMQKFWQKGIHSPFWILAT
jgi:hypothetical protein